MPRIVEAFIFNNAIKGVVKMETKKLKEIAKDCKIQKIGKWLWVSGKTYKIKEQLKELGFFYSSSKKAWFWNVQEHKGKMAFCKDIQELINKWGVEDVVL